MANFLKMQWLSICFVGHTNYQIIIKTFVEFNMFWTIFFFNIEPGFVAMTTGLLEEVPASNPGRKLRTVTMA